jgi:A/G-specific adenine glycosylase
VSEFPVKLNRPKTKELYLYYFLIHSGEFIFLKKREGKGIWQNLYEFPSVESEIPLSFEELVKCRDFQALFPGNTCHSTLVDAESRDTFLPFKLLVKNYKHVLTHRILYADFYEVSAKNPLGQDKYRKIRQSEIGEYPIHRLMQRFMEKFTGDVSQSMLI